MHEKYKAVENGTEITKEDLSTPFLSFETVHEKNEEGKIESEFGVKFDTEAHARKIEHVMNWYHVNI